ncbi:hypothetical protein [Bacteroides acidifaciens]|nr:hypothetical protein [Bacteroides acidifaciens]
MAARRIKQEKLRNPQQLKITEAKQQGIYLEEAFWDFKVRVICGISMSAV